MQLKSYGSKGPKHLKVRLYDLNIAFKFINKHYNNPFASHFKIDKIKELIVWKYYWSSFKKNIKAYFKGCDICLISKTIRYKLYINLKSMLIPIHCWKNISIDFLTSVLVSTNQNRKTYNLILVIIIKTFFSWIKVIRVDLIYQSYKLYISKIRPDLIYIYSLLNTQRWSNRSRVIYKILIYFEQQAWLQFSWST